MLTKKVRTLVEKEMKSAESTIQKDYEVALQAVEQAIESGIKDIVEDAKGTVSHLPSGEAKKSLMEVLRNIPEREKIENLDELKEKGLTIIEDDMPTVENHIMQILKEKGLLVSDLAKLTGISRQNINAVVKNKMKPGVDFALKVSHVLGLSVEELFTLTDGAWVKPYKQERDATLYVDVVNLMILDNTAKKEEIAKNGSEYYNKETQTFLTREEYDSTFKQFMDKHTDKRVEKLQEESGDLSSAKVLSLAKEELRKEFNDTYVKMYRKLGERIQPYVINSKKVVSKS